MKFDNLKYPLGFLILMILPIWLDAYGILQITLALNYAIAVIGLNIIIGYSGQLSLGHSAFFALGAYLPAIFANKYGLPVGFGIPLACLICFIAGALLGLPVRNLRGLYLAVVTLMLALMVIPLVKFWEPITGGVKGLFVMAPQPPEILAWLENETWIYYIVAICLMLSIWVGRNFVNSGMGRALDATRELPVAALALGINIGRYKVLAFAVGGMFAGLGGGLMDLTTEFVAPDSFTIYLAIGFLVGTVVGGKRTIAGAIIGGLFLQFVPTWASEYGESLAGLIYGAILILVLNIAPNGVVAKLLDMFKQTNLSKQNQFSK